MSRPRRGWRVVAALGLSLASLVPAASAASAPNGASEPGATLKWSRRGRDASGALVQEILKIDPDGRIEWSYAGIGGSCPDRGGESEGTAPPELRRQLAELARAAIAEQKQLARGRSTEAPSQAAVATLLSLDQGQVFLDADFVADGPAWDKLEESLLTAREKTAPVSAVRLHAAASRDGLTILVLFQLLGSSPFKVLLPDKASISFSGQSGPLEYARPPARLDVTLTAEAPRLIVRLRARAPGGRLVRYSNATLQHHGRAGPGGYIDYLAPLSLCASW